MQGENCRFAAAAPAKPSTAKPIEGRTRDGPSVVVVEEQRPAATFGFIDSNWPESRFGRARVRVASPVCAFLPRIFFLPFSARASSHRHSAKR